MRWLVVCFLAAGCSNPAPRADHHEEKPKGADAATPTETNMGEPVEVKYLGIEPGHPPMATVRLEVTLRNNANQPRWFILPMELGQPPSRPTKPGEGVDGASVVALEGKGRVVIGRFQGRAGVQAILLPANGHVRIDRLKVMVFEEQRGKMPVDVVVATSLTVGGEPGEKWMGDAPQSDAGADVSEDKATTLGSRHTPDRREVPIQWDEAERVTTSIEL
jgi:hypothetical protein